MAVRALLFICVLLAAIPLTAWAQGHGWALACDSKGGAHCARTDYSSGGLVYCHWDGNQWSGNVVLSKGTYPFDPQVACDAQDRVHVVWSDKASYLDNADLYYAVFDEKGWSKPVDISKAAGWECRASMVILPNGDIHVVYTRGQGMFTTNPPGIRGSVQDAPIEHLVCKGGEWSKAAELLDAGMGYGYLCADPRGQITGAFMGGNMPNMCVFIRRWKDDAWSEPEAVPGTQGVSGSVFSLAADAAGKLHIGFSTMMQSKLCYMTQTDKGWTAPTPIGELALGYGSFQVVGGPDGTVHLAFPARFEGAFRPGLGYQRLKDGKWETAVPVAGDTPQETALAADKEGNAHIVWGGPRQFYHVYSKDGQWQTGAGGQ